MLSHQFSELFDQLGLPSDVTSISQFIKVHTPLNGTIKLADASFWTPEQAIFLCEEILKDSDWAEVIDQLNAALRLVMC